ETLRSTLRVPLLSSGPLLGLLLLAACGASPAASSAPASAAKPAASVSPASSAPAAVASKPAASAAAAASKPAPSGAIKIKVATQGIAANAPPYIAQDRGYFKEQG